MLAYLQAYMRAYIYANRYIVHACIPVQILRYMYAHVYLGILAYTCAGGYTYMSKCNN